MVIPQALLPSENGILVSAGHVWNAVLAGSDVLGISLVHPAKNLRGVSPEHNQLFRFS